MAIYIHTFERAVFVEKFDLGIVSWSHMLRTTPHSDMIVPAGTKEDISSDISTGPRRSVLRTYKSPRNRNDTIGELEVYEEPLARGKIKEVEISEQEVQSSTIRIDASHSFVPVYQPGIEGLLIYRVVQYVPFAEIRTEDLKLVLVNA